MGSWRALGAGADEGWITRGASDHTHPRPLPRAADPPAKAERAALLNSMLLRRHFQELTQALLFPLLPYISPAPPPPAPASAAGGWAR